MGAWAYWPLTCFSLWWSIIWKRKNVNISNLFRGEKGVNFFPIVKDLVLCTERMHIATIEIFTWCFKSKMVHMGHPFNSNAPWPNFRWSVQTGPRTRFMEAIRRYEIKYHVSGPRRPNENPAEQSIHEIKKRWYRIMLKKKVPPRLWDYGFTWVCETENICANFSKHAHGWTPLEIITGETPDISEYLDFEF